MSNPEDSPERWAFVPGYEYLYEVSDRGQVRGCPRSSTGLIQRQVHGRVLSQTVRGGRGNKQGYRSVLLCRNGRGARFQVHRLVLMAFVGPCPEGMEGCHNNGDRFDNRLSNLRWDTHASNMTDRADHSSADGDRCKRGHEFTPENTYQRPNGRECKACRVLHRNKFRGKAA